MSHAACCDQCGYSNAPETSRCVLIVHTCPRALLSHVEWAVSAVLGPGRGFDWQEQELQRGTYRAEITFSATPGIVSKLVSDLKSFPGLRFEATQEAVAGFEGERFSYTPQLGIHRSGIDPIGETLVTESRIRSAMARAASPSEAIRELELLMGDPWDQELEPYRFAGAGCDEVRWVHEVG